MRLFLGPDRTWHDTAAPLLAAALIFAACGTETPAPSGPEDPGPVVAGVVPDRVTPGQEVAISGSGFGSDPAEVTVMVEGALVEVLSVAPGQIVVRIPSETGPGLLRIEVLVSGSPAAGTALLTVVSPGETFASVSAGGGFTCGTRPEGGALCWGSAARGALGQPTSGSQRPRPGRVSGGEGFVAVSAGSAHACALDGAGRAFCWGRNDSGQVGDGSFSDAPVPVEVTGGIRFSSVSAGSHHTCAVTLDGTAHCWGANESGQLGDGTRTASPVPVAVGGGLAFAEVSAGGLHSCGLTRTGEAFCWGDNGHGELGDGSGRDAELPVRVAGGHSFQAVSAGTSPKVGLASVGEHTCALTADGAALCWGYNAYGQVGDGSFEDRLTPVAVATTSRFRALSAGAFYTCGLTDEAAALCWGQNDSGQLGVGPTNPSVPLPAPVLGGLRFTAISAGDASKTVLAGVRPHTCAVAVSGIAYCWGHNGSGELGSGSSSPQSPPVPVAALRQGASLAEHRKEEARGLANGAWRRDTPPGREASGAAGAGREGSAARRMAEGAGFEPATRLPG